MEYSNVLVFFVNGKKVVEKNVDPEWTLLYYLRNKLCLTGTKLGCGEGGCGACTVMISKYNRPAQRIKHFAVNACITPVCSIHGMAVTTVEGIGSTKTKLHPVQERIAKSHGSQCGFCTPGIVMSMYSLLRDLPKPSLDDLEACLQGNLCRCTGYRPIIDGYKTFTENWQNTKQNCSLGEQCCQNQRNVSNCNGELKNSVGNETLVDSNEFVPYDPSQEPIFPPELKLDGAYDAQYLKFIGPTVTWFRPLTLQQLAMLKSNYPNAKIINGNTEIGIETKFKQIVYSDLICPNSILELTQIVETETGFEFGAAITLDEMKSFLNQKIFELPEQKTRIFREIVKILHVFASKQIRNVGSWAGNLITGSPISDLNIIFLAINAELLVTNLKGRRKVRVDENFFTGYRKNIIAKDEILVSIHIPYSTEGQYFYASKQAKRKDDDIAIVNMALFLELDTKTNRISNIRITYGGMAPKTVVASKTCQQLLNKEFNDNILDNVFERLLEDLPLAPDAPGGMINYRKTLSLSLFFKGYLHIKNMLESNDPFQIYLEELNESQVFRHTKSSQIFTVSKDKLSTDTIGTPVVHMSAFKHGTGEAIYCDDIPKYENELYLSFVVSKKAHAKIISIDASKIYTIPGIIGFVSAKDLTEEQNSFGAIFQDQEVFARNCTQCYGQIIGAVVGKTKEITKKAIHLVDVQYEDINPIILTIDEAIKTNSYFPNYPKVLKFGNSDEAFKRADHIIQNQYEIGGQEHFYLETQCTIAIPREEDEMEIIASTQDPAETSKLVAHMLGIPINRVVTKVKRIGGGFGGKETACFMITLPVALAAYKFKKPVRCMLDRDEDFLMTGGRNPAYFDYKVGFTKDGKLVAIDVKIYLNAGFTHDLSPAVLERAMFHIQNVYKIDNITVTGYLCKTNLPSQTAFRAFGVPQALLAAETMIREIAEYLNKDIIEIMKLNLYRENDILPHTQKLEYCNLERCIDECLNSSQFRKRQEDVEIFNSKNTFKKRGISFVPIMFGISFDVLFMNQAGALVHVYVDGSVLLTHGGIEMGQGLHTKMIQVASKVLNIPITKIYTSEISTDKVPNTIATAGSTSSDLNGFAVMNACNTIVERLKPYREANPKGQWEDWIQAAYFDRVSLSATGFYRTPDITGFDWETCSGRTYHYYSFGAGCSEVEIDCLTGDHKILRTDIVMDIGESLNPAIDIGQIEGAFVQGYGLYVLEEIVYTRSGDMFTKGPNTYKIPSFSNVPREFNVSVLRGAPNPRAIYSSKAVGEPPLGLSITVLFAIREAIKARRKDCGINDTFILNAPATSEKIRMCCVDNILLKIKK